MSSLRWNPSDTPLTMFCSSARVVPASARPLRDSGMATLRRSPSRSTVMPAGSSWLISPFLPLSVTRLPFTVTSTPAGSLIGSFATRDMSGSSRHDADDFAAHALGAGLAVRQHALRRGHDGDAQAAQHLRQLVLGAVAAQARRAHALEALDDRPALEVLEVDGERLLRAVPVHAVAGD